MDVAHNIKIIAHRSNIAGPNPSKENTLDALEEAFATLGINGVEFDIEITRDGEIVINNRDWRNNKSPTIHLSYRELIQIYAGKNIPTAEDALSLIHKAFVNHKVLLGNFIADIEIKKDEDAASDYPKNYEERILDLISCYLKPPQYVIKSFDLEAVKKVKNINPGLTSGLLLKSNINDEVTSANGYEKWQKIIGDPNINFMAPHFSSLQKFKARQLLQASGKPIYIWTVEPNDFNEFLKDDTVYAIVTNYAKEAINYREKYKHKRD